MELAVRLVGPESFSVDLTHIHELPRIAASRPEVLFAGSSVVREGIDPAILGHGKMMLDDATVPMWYFALKRHFLRGDLAPRWIVLGFFDWHLEGRRVNAPELARYFSETDDLPLLLGTTLTDFGGRADFALNRLSLFYSLRERIGRRVLSSLLPGYREAAQTVARLSDARIPKHEPDFLYLRQLTELAASQGTRLAAVRMPARTAQPGDPRVNQELQRLGIPLIDLSVLPELNESCFKDEIHVNEEGARLLSLELRRRLMALWRSLETERS